MVIFTSQAGPDLLVEIQAMCRAPPLRPPRTANRSRILAIRIGTTMGSWVRRICHGVPFFWPAGRWLSSRGTCRHSIAWKQ